MKLFLYLFYHSVRNLVLLAFRIFYRKTAFFHRDRLKVNGPTVVVSNHPSTMTDPLNVAARMNTMVHFLANGGLFQHWFSNWFFSTFYCIPIERPVDAGKRKINNAESFARCDEFLSGGGCLYIAPEGGSHIERRLQRLKTGTARIALSAENKNNFKLGLVIRPVGLDYSDQTRFRNDVVVNPGEVICVADYEQAYREDPIAAVRQLTADLTEQLEALVIHTQDDQEDKWLRELEAIQQAFEPLDIKAHFTRTCQTLNQLQSFRQTGREFENWKNDLEKLQTKLKEQGTDHLSLYEARQENLLNKNRQGLLALILGFPLFLYGWINNWLANATLGYLAEWLKPPKLYIGYQSTIKLMGSLVFYPLFYGLQFYLVQRLGGNGWLTLAYALLLFPTGIFAWRYRARWQAWRKGRNLLTWQAKASSEVKSGMAMQEGIMNRLQQAEVKAVE